MRAADIFDVPLFKGGRPKRRGIPVTVCIAARSGDTIVCASDRMLTSGDIQFEPNRQKIYALTKSIIIMTAGDASFLDEVIANVNYDVRAEFEAKPNEWISIPWVVDRYVDAFNRGRLRQAERAILGPLGLNNKKFLKKQGSMDPGLVHKLSAALLDYQAPNCAVIITGRDAGGTYIVTIHGTEVNHHETVGFAAVGIGDRHAQSQFMLARHAWNDPLSDALLRTYIAKRRSEVAPGVGGYTDIVIIGPDLGSSTLVNDEVKAHLEAEYQRILRAEQEAAQTARDEIAGYLNQLTSPSIVVTEQKSEDGPSPEVDSEP